MWLLVRMAQKRKWEDVIKKIISGGKKFKIRQEEIHPLLLPEIIGEVAKFIRHDLSTIFSLAQVCKAWKKTITEELKELVLNDEDFCRPVSQIHNFLRTFTRVERLSLSTNLVFKRSLFIAIQKYLHKLKHLSCTISFVFNHPDLSKALASITGLTSLEFRCKTVLPPLCCTLFENFSNLTNIRLLRLSQQNAYFVSSDHCCIVTWLSTLTKLEVLKLKQVMPEQSVFMQLTNLTVLQLIGLTHLPDTISLLTNLLHLTLDSRNLLSSTPTVLLEQLTSLSKLTQLTLASHVKLEPLTVLGSFPKLKVLNIEKAWLSRHELTPKNVKNLTDLEKLYISPDNPLLSGTSHFPQLTYLNIAAFGIQRVKQNPAICVPKLQHLQYHSFNPPVDLPFISPLTHLQTLILDSIGTDDKSQFISFAFLSNFVRLEHLTLADMEVAPDTFAALRTLTRLTHLYAPQGATDEQIRIMCASLTNLQSLGVSCAFFSERTITSLTALPFLRTLSITVNENFDSSSESPPPWVTHLDHATHLFVTVNIETAINPVLSLVWESNRTN